MAIEYNGYTSRNIHVAEGAERHRSDPARYLNSRYAEGIENQLFELLDNAIDETMQYYKVLTRSKKFIVEHSGKKQPLKDFLAEYNETVPPLVVYLEINEENRVFIKDPGRGLPCDTPVDKNGNPTGKEPGIFPIYENDSAGGKKIHSKKLDDADEDEEDAYDAEDISGMHGAGAAVSKSCTTDFIINTRTMSCNLIGEGKGCYSLRYEKGKRDLSKSPTGLIYTGELSQEHPNEILRKYNVPYTGTDIEYMFDDTVLYPIDDQTLEQCDPYNKDAIIKRIRLSLLGSSNRDSILVEFTYHGETITISPNDYTPESILGVDESSDTLAIMDLQSPDDAKEADMFKARLYLNYNPSSYGYKSTTVLNRLPLFTTPSDRTIQKVIRTIVDDELHEWYKKQGNKIKKPPARQSDVMDYFEVVLVMGMPLPEFSSQTKDNLKSIGFLTEFGLQLRQILLDNIEYLKPAIDKRKEDAINYTKLQENLEAIRAKEEKKKKEKQDEADLQKEIEEENKSLEKRIGAKMKESAFRIKINETLKDPKISPVAFFEGDAAIGAVKTCVDQGEPLTMVTVTGKLPNVYDKKNVGSMAIRVLRKRIFASPAPYYIIFTDPDPDGAHIRMLILALIAEYKPEMLLNEKVFVIRAPYGAVWVDEGCTVIISNSYEGQRQLLPGFNFVNSYSEMVSALAQGATFQDAYPGVARVIANCENRGITVQELLHNPQYKVPIAAPTKEELDYLKSILTPNSEIKKRYVNRYYTDRQRYSKFLKSANNGMRVKGGDGKCIETITQSISDTPTIKNYQSLSLLGDSVSRY